ncbi:hypothetical protein SDC9_178343 [bioreactor metagenome]|uniref:Uncharacterized protein n=1 Tax=bioreactor metagenome TaxID=1076179 RepID=A0A645GXU6_9ZZZZ
MSASGLFGRREEAMRAGIRTVNAVEVEEEAFIFGCFLRESRDMYGLTVQKAAEQAKPTTAEQEPPRGEGGVPLPGGRREATQGVHPPSGGVLQFFVAQLPRLVLQHHRNAVAHGIGQAGTARDQFLALAVIGQRTFGDGADQQFKQFGIHGGVLRARRMARPVGHC